MGNARFLEITKQSLTRLKNAYGLPNQKEVGCSAGRAEENDDAT